MMVELCMEVSAHRIVSSNYTCLMQLHFFSSADNQPRIPALCRNDPFSSGEHVSVNSSGSEKARYLGFHIRTQYLQIFHLSPPTKYLLTCQCNSPFLLLVPSFMSLFDTS